MIFISVTAPGGTGKTTTASLFVEGLSMLGIKPRLGQIEGDERARLVKLAQAWDRTLDMNIVIAKPSILRQDPRRAQVQFASLLEIFENTDKSVWVFDMAATLSSSMFEVAESLQHGDDCDQGSGIVFLVPTKAGDADRKLAAQDAIQKAHAIYKKSKIVLVINQGPLDSTAQKKLADDILRIGTPDSIANYVTAVVHIPEEPSVLTKRLFEANNIPHGTIINYAPADLAKVLDMPRIEAKLEQQHHAQWYNSVMEQIKNLLRILKIPARSKGSNAS